MIPIGLCAQLACMWEATARKPGNVHPYRSFVDTTYLDFLLSAAAIAPVLEKAPQRKVGETILEAVRAARLVTTANTNLGIILLLAPLAAVPDRESLRARLPQVLHELNLDDARHVYQAIRLVAPAGLGRVPEQDVAGEPTQDLRQVMTLAANRDLVARQYTNGFAEVFDEGIPVLLKGLDKTRSLEAAIIRCHLHLMASHPDTLIARKRGLAEAVEASARARRVLEEDWPRAPTSWAELAKLDRWLRSEGHSRNPGTSADLVTACLFVCLRETTISLPLQFPWSAGEDHE